MKLTKILAAGIMAATMVVTASVAASATTFDPANLVSMGSQDNAAPTGGDTATPTTTEPTTTTPIVTAPQAGDTAAPTNSSKGSPNTGVFDIFPLAAVALVSGGVVIATKKKKK